MIRKIRNICKSIMCFIIDAMLLLVGILAGLVFVLTEAAFVISGIFFLKMKEHLNYDETQDSFLTTSYQTLQN